MKVVDFYSIFLKSTGVKIDSRKINPENIFFGLKGNNLNGNLYAEKAIQQGALASIVDEKQFEDKPKNIFFVDDTLRFLQELAKFHRNKLTNTTFIGITGSNGKTTSKELIASVLSQKFNIQFTKGNYNNHIGVPLTLLSVKEKHEFAIIEMGANHQKEIEFLCTIAQPDYGYITNFGKAHLEGFGSVEGIIKGKSELYDFLSKKNKSAFVNFDIPKQIQKSKEVPNIISFSEIESKGDYQIKLISPSPTISVEFKKNIINSNLPGKYNFSNIASAITIGANFGLNISEIKKGIESYISENNRSQWIDKNGFKILMDAYNANPTSMLHALDNFNELKEEKSVILGDMNELGYYSSNEHEQIVDYLTCSSINNFYLIGNEFFKQKIDFENMFFFKEFDEFKNFIIKNKFSNKTLLIKGSRSCHLERVLDLI